MNAEINVLKSTAKVTVTTTLETSKVLGNLFVYKLTQTHTSLVDGDIPIMVNVLNDSQQGFITHEGILAYRKSNTPLKKADQYGFFYDEAFPKLAQLGWFSQWPEAAKLRFQPPISTKPFDDFVSGKVAVHNLAEYMPGANAAKCVLTQKMIPVALTLGYIGFNMDNSAYKLRKAYDILSQRSDIVFMDDDDKFVSSKEEAIFSVPHYNRTSARTLCMNVVWRPSQEDYDALWEKCIALSTKEAPFYGRNEAIFDLDLLGLRAGGAALYDSFYKSRDNQSDDEE